MGSKAPGDERGLSAAFIVATVALAVAIAALVVALTREPHNSSSATEVPTTSTQTQVPDVTGKAAANAQNVLHDAGLLWTVTAEASNRVAPGVVARQNPIPGTLVLRGSSVTLIVSVAHR